jgi:FkbH-like protein
MRRRPLKAIVLDCDNTLWRGVCGEDGAPGLHLDPPYLALQRFMLKQYEAGMLLCLCSKNSEEDVLAVFEQRSDMILTREHLVSSRINWLPKSQNLKALAEELDLGLNSFIFVDDNPLECAEVTAHCPEVLTVQLPADARQIPQVLQNFWAFDRMTVTDEDKKRSAYYRQNLQREQLRREGLTFRSFLEELELEISIHPVEPEQLPRVAQLTQRTNQFNLTTIRRTEGDIQTLCERDGYECLVTEVSDRFGDYGLVGGLLFRVNSGAIHVESFLLSCRALGRGVEHRMLAALGKLAVERGLKRVDVEYIPSPKNPPAFDFLERCGAEFKEEREDKTVFSFPAESVAGIEFHPQEGTADGGPQAADAGQQAANDGRRAAEDSQEALREIATELYDADRILDAISAQKHHARPDLESDFVAPRTPVEESLAKVWLDVLGLDRVGVYDDFFRLGGHSLLATQILSRVIERFQVNLPLQSLLQHPTIAGVAELLEALDWTVKGAAHNILENDEMREEGEI